MFVCENGVLREYNLSNNTATVIPFKIDGISCTGGGLEIIYRPSLNKFALVVGITYKGLHAVAQIALPSAPKVTELKFADEK